MLDAYIRQKEMEYGKNYTDKLGMPVYAIRDCILDFIGKLHNKSVNIGAIEPQDFGTLLNDESHGELHELFASVIPAVEQEYFEELLENNKIHLSSMMSVLNRFINNPDSESRLRELKKDKHAPQFMFVDEFQDTDDSQIESLLRIAQILDYKLFLVGDIKQCIYRFRGAKEKAFDQLGIEKTPDKWLEFSLQRNYRTDKYLLDIFDSSFTKWGKLDDELLTYDKEKDRLVGTRDYNGNYLANVTRFYRRLPAASEEMRIPVLVGELERIQKRIQYEESHGMKLSAKEKSIAILVRENWQADMVRTECAHFGISVRTNTGGDLYMSQPAIDMLTLVNALVHFDEADYLYNLVTSNFFELNIPKSNLYEIRMRIRTGGWRAKCDEKEQVNYLINFMNLMLANTVDKNNKWEYIVASLRTQPVLQSLRKIYSTLEPWKHFSDDPWKQHYYQLNVDLLFEQIINACNVDRLTINTLQEHLHNSIVSRVSVDSRTPTQNEEEPAIQCITVHKSKGLEYGHVIMPFCSASMDFIKRTQLQISTTKYQGRYRIGYSMSIGDTGETVQNNFYDEKIEKSEKGPRRSSCPLCCYDKIDSFVFLDRNSTETEPILAESHRNGGLRMPFKIYTYEDPYKLDKADFWSEISSLPHFCSARTLVNGLKDVLGDNIKGLICPLDELVQHEEVYMRWTDNISLRVQQYSAFSATFKQLLGKRRISKPFYMALEQNQNHFLEAVRLFIELDIPASAIDGNMGNTEQKLFVYMLKMAQKKFALQFPGNAFS